MTLVCNICTVTHKPVQVLHKLSDVMQIDAQLSVLLEDGSLWHLQLPTLAGIIVSMIHVVSLGAPDIINSII